MSAPRSGFHPLSLLVRFWSAPVRPEPLALFRILLGINLLANLLLTILPHLDLLLSLCPAQALDGWLKRSGRFCLLRGPISIPFLRQLLPEDWSTTWADWGATAQAAWILAGVYLAALVFFTLGLATRLAAIVCWALECTLYTRLSWSMNGGDAVARMALFYLIFSRCGAVWSLDHALRRWWNPISPRVPLIPPWPIRLMQIQLCMVYLFTGIVKLGQTILTPAWYTCDWINGEAVYWVFNDLALSRWPYHWTPFPMWFCRLLTWGTMIFELGFSILVLFRWTRPWCLLAGAALHLGIWLHVEIAWFSQFMLCWYVLFLSPDTVTGVVRTLARLWPFHSRAEIALPLSVSA